MTPQESQLEDLFIEKLLSLKYDYRADIRDRAALEKNFRQKFEALNCFIMPGIVSTVKE